MSLYILFGLPGVGKTYAGNVFKDQFNYHLYDGDRDMSKEMRDVILSRGDVSDEMRDEFFERQLVQVKNLINKYKRLVVTQTYIKEKYRKKVLEAFPQARFILVETDTKLRESRLAKRVEFPLDMEYARRMCLLFEEPKIPHELILNNVEGEEEIKRQITLLLDNVT